LAFFYCRPLFIYLLLGHEAFDALPRVEAEQKENQMNTQLRALNNNETDIQAYHGDGLLDIFLGAGLLIATAAMIAKMPWMAGVFPATFVPIWRDARRKMTIPRLAQYEIDTGSGQRAMALVAGVTLVGVIGLLLGLVVFLLAASDRLPAWLGSSWELLSVGIIGGLALILPMVTGVILEGARRYLLYTGLSAAILILTMLLDLSLFFPMVALGLILVGGGLMKMTQFLRKYPLKWRKPL
jgi:hypothetical protein